MKRPLLLLSFLLPFAAGAQLLYIDTMHVRELRGTTTLFVLPAEDSALRAEYEAAINAGWTFTPHRIVTAAEMAQYRDAPGYSFFLEFYMGLRPHNDPDVPGNLAVALAATFTRSAVEHAHDDKSLMRQTVAGDSMGLRRGYYLHCGLAMVLPEHEYKVFTPCAEIRMGRARDREEYLAALKTNAQHYHTAPLPPDPYWRNYMSPGQLKMYLHILSTTFATGTDPRQFYAHADTAALSVLHTDTLYIQDYIIPHLLSVNGIDTGRAAADSIWRSAYPYPYRFVSNAQLSDLLLRAARPVHFITYSFYDDADRASELAEKKVDGTKMQVIYTGLKIFNSEKGLIYASFPHARGIRVSPMVFERDILAIANAVR